MELPTLALLLVMVLLSSWEAAAVLDCIDEVSGELIDGQFVENGVCVEDSVWYYALVPAPIASNGLHAGEPTHFHLWFGSLGNPVEDAFDFDNYGLFIDGGMAKMTLDLSPHFIYDESNKHPAQPLFTTEMGLGPANIMFPSPCVYDLDTQEGRTSCSGWTSNLGQNKNQIDIIAPDGLFGRRALEAGIKFFHLHPVIELASPIYNNANGTCDDGLNETSYCRFDSDCAFNSTCMPALEPFTASVTATLYDKEGGILHKGKRSYVFDTSPEYAVYSTNTGVAAHLEPNCMIDFQRVEPGSECINITRAEGSELCSSAAPYAPRFFIFGPNFEGIAFPGPKVAEPSATLTSTTTGSIFSDQQEIATFELVQPDGANGEILTTDNLGYIRDGPRRIGGTIFAVPVKAGDIPGRYYVQMTLTDGRYARSRFIVTEPTSSGFWVESAWFIPVLGAVLAAVII